MKISADQLKGARLDRQKLTVLLAALHVRRVVAAGDLFVVEQLEAAFLGRTEEETKRDKQMIIEG